MNVFPHAVYTIGYGQRSLDELLVPLRLYHIGCVIDVRSHPWSRWKPQYIRRDLETFLRDNGIEYVFMGDQLGGRPDIPALRRSDGRMDYERLVQQDFFQAGLKRLQRAFDTGLRMCLLCAEQKPEQCHRFWLIGRELQRRSLPVLHIDEKNNLLTQEEVLSRTITGQTDLFEDDRPIH
ncbi:MAG: hypothetical protein Kow0059_10200 [Candidatus Sumerlaeia bacterium]